MSKRPFSPNTKYQYDPSVEGYGNARQWKSAFNKRMGLDAAKEAVGSGSPYDILGVSAKATWDEIKKVYRKLVMKHHPDKGGQPATFRKIQGAYEILEDRHK
jgi:DnaJ-class molecular chaperone